MSGWVSLEQFDLDIADSRQWNTLFGTRKASAVLAEHVLEHLSFSDAKVAMRNIAGHLAADGHFRMAVPDGYHPSQYVVDLVKPGGLEPGADDHRHLWTIDDVHAIESAIGLTARPLEWFSSDGAFHQRDWNPEDGRVSRSRRFYDGRFTNDTDEMTRLLESTPEHLRHQFSQSGLSYTSLIIDWTLTPVESNDGSHEASS